MAVCCHSDSPGCALGVPTMLTSAREVYECHPAFPQGHSAVGSFCCRANLVLQTLGTLGSLTCAAIPRSCRCMATDPLLCLDDTVILSSSLEFLI